MAQEKNAATVVATFAAQQAAKITKLAQESIQKFESMVEQIPAKEDAIRQLEEKQASLALEIKEQERKEELDLTLRLKENKQKVVDATLKELGMTAVSNDELKGYQSLKTEFNTEVEKQTKVAVAIAKAGHESEMKLKDAMFQTTQAQNEAKLASQELVIENLKEQVETLKEQIEEDRKARVEEAKARGSVQLNMPAGNGR